jgi:hypothetical protein
VDPGVFTFANHGCNGTNNIGTKLNSTELSIDDNTPYKDVFDGSSDAESSLDAYSYYFDRAPQIWYSAALVNIVNGDEILDNYLSFGGVGEWEDNLLELKSLCTGLLERATVLKYEQSTN